MKKISILISVLAFLLLISLLLDNLILNLIEKIRFDFLDNFMILFSKYFNYYIIALLVTSLILFFKNNKLKRLVIIWLTFITSLVSVFILKNIFMIPRPNLSLIEASSYSFPSGHTTLMFAILSLIWFNFPDNKLIKYSWLFLTILTAFSRIYLKVHYLTDILAGALLGLIISELIIRVFLTLEINKKQ